VGSGPTSQQQLTLRVRSIVNEAIDINSFELVHPRGEPLPRFTAGAHVDVMVPGGPVRQYSLCNDPRDEGRYVIAVLRLPDGRGGSRGMHEAVRAGGELEVSEPRNTFALVESARRHVLIAGGIGVTPLMAMVERLDVLDADYTLHYCTKSPAHTAFRDRLADREQKGRVVYHHDGGDPARGIRLDEVLAEYEPGTQLYHCGPPGLMAAVARAASHWPPEAVRCEYFTPPAGEPGAAPAVAGGFSIRLARSGRELTVPPDRSIVEVLREAGIDCATSCEAGLCGTCRTRYLEGTPEHHDLVLDDDERDDYLTICCARSQSEVLVLDL
jgi:vanillate O-demethylase ferredoxin subunit